MALSAKTVRGQIAMLQPLLRNLSLDTIRKGQSKLGEIMSAVHSSRVLIKEHSFSCFDGAWILPRDERRQGAILYLHGGGYTCGDLEYAKAFGSVLAVECGVRTLTIGYRLAPESPFPSAIDDAEEAYRYLLQKGYQPNQIALCGESAGGGLCYSLCLRLMAEDLPLPGGIIVISPWTDLTMSGSSYEQNQDIDISISRDILEFYAGAYTTDRKDPLASPLFANLDQMPPSLIFVGGDEIMRSDSEELHKKLQSAGRISELIVVPERWHGFLLYGLQEDKGSFQTINRFLNRYISAENKLRWVPLDNAAKIYPAVRNKNWSNVFRLSATLKEDVDTAILQSALDVTVRRFPVLCARLRRGVFWYYLQELQQAPEIREENCYPLVRMYAEEMGQCAFRVIIYKKRVAIEMFHALTDGTGGLVFLKTLLAEYIFQKYGVHVSATCGVLGRLEEPTPEEMEDSFQKYAGPVSASRRGNDAWQVFGTPEADNFMHVTCLRLKTEELVRQAKAIGVTVTVYLCAVMMDALQEMQAEKIKSVMHRKAIKVQIPVNLRSLFPSRSLRNFALYTTPEIDPRLGHYSFAELCDVVRSRMALEINPKFMSTMIATNIRSEKILAVRVIPLFVKNLIMKMVFDAVGERKSCLSFSNLGLIRLPEEMDPYIDRFDFILGVQASAPYNCGVVSYGDTTCVNFIRNIRESELEYHFFKALQRRGLSVEAESNAPQ
ncbi:MAG: steryl acetyl hydrolase [Ruminococcaceae bacterium]|nr:steryl acetyl hydrolase [Oscillospiraceae bacterium]